MGIYENFRDVVGVIQKLDNIELYKKILDIQAQALELWDSNIEKDKKIRELENIIESSKDMEFNGNFYVIEGENHPYCPGCWCSKKIKTHLVYDPNKSDEYIYYKCPVNGCNFDISIDNPNYIPPPKEIESDDEWDLR